jgi:hypothetical protein
MRQKESFESKELFPTNMGTSSDIHPAGKPTIKELKVILGKVQHPTHDYTEITPNIILGGM